METSRLSVQRKLRPRIAKPHALPIHRSFVAARIVSVFGGTVYHSKLLLPLLKARVRGLSWDATGKHICFAFLCGSGTSDGRVCFVNSDSGNPRTLDTQIYIGGVTVATCIDGCFHKGYNHAGVEFANECCTCRLVVELFFPE